MSDLGTLEVDPGAQGGAAPMVAPKHRVRRIISWVLIVLFTILTPITLISVWALNTVTNTDRYVATLAPLGRDPVVTTFVADEATDKIFSQFEIQKRIQSALPGPASFIAKPLTNELHGFTQTQLRKVTSSEFFAKLWEQELRYTHQAAIALLTGKATPAVSRSRAVLVSVTPVITKGIDALDQQGITVFNPIRNELAKNRILTLQLVTEKQLKKATWFFNLAIKLRWVLLVGTPLIGLAAIGVGVRRRRVALRVALGGILGTLFAIVALTIARQTFINNVAPKYQEVSTHVFDTVTRYLHGSTRWTLLVFVLLALLFWAIGDTKWATALRQAIGSGTKKVGVAAEGAATSDAARKVIDTVSRGAAFVARTATVFRWAGVGLAAIFLVSERTASSVLWTVLFLVIYEIVIGAIAWWSHRQDTTGGTRDPALPSTTSETEVPSSSS